MPQKVDARIETIFSHAAALEQSGRLRNFIFVIDREVYILNQDHTVFLRFQLPSGTKFSSSVSFKAADYDSPVFSDREGMIVFEQSAGDMVRRKSCTTPGRTPEEIRDMFSEFPVNRRNQISIHKDILQLLDEKLSHIEISGSDSKLKIVQRNIYDGTVIEISRKDNTGFGVSSSDKINTDFGPVGLRTNDFVAIFSFNDRVTFSFGEGKLNYCRLTGRNFKMTGVIALCLYDEMGDITTIKEEKTDGRKKQKRTRSKQKPNSQIEKGKRRKPVRKKRVRNK